MTKIRFTILIVMLCMFSVNIQAQRHKKRKPQPKKEIVEEPVKTPGQLLYDNMLPSTAKIVIFDSVLVRKENAVGNIPLNKEYGELKTSNTTPAIEANDSMYTYINEYGNKCFFSRIGSDGKSHLYTADKLGDEWSQPQLIEELEAGFEDIRNPYMMPDGITMYFAAKGENSIGGYDIFVTMYDTEESKFYKPENIGLPFNSFADDLFYIVNETDSLGWFATNRNQATDTLCIYSFVPSKSRETYNIDDITPEQLNGYATISNIKSTWYDKNIVRQALKRQDNAKKEMAQKEDIETSMSFVINDDITYKSISQFKSAKARGMLTSLYKMYEKLNIYEKKLESLREGFQNIDKRQRKTEYENIYNMENEIIELRSTIHKTEKDIRNAENIELYKL